LAGSTDSLGVGGYNSWLIKVDASGDMEWSQTYGEVGDDGINYLVQTSNGALVLAGYTYSYASGHNNFWLAEAGSDGKMLWNRTYNEGSDGVASSLVQTNDGYVVVGTVESGSGDAYWLLKTNLDGYPQWNQTFSNSGDNVANSLIQSNDGGYAIAGYTDAMGAGGYDFNLIKTTSLGTVPTGVGFRWNSLEGFLIIGAAVAIAVGVIYFAMARVREPNKPTKKVSV